MVIIPLFLLALMLPTGMAQIGELVGVWETPQPYSESIAYDRANGRLLLTSLISNTIAAVDPKNEMALLTSYSTFDEGENGAGIKVSISGQIYAVSSIFDIQDIGGLSVVDLPVTDSEHAAAVPYWEKLSTPCTFKATNCGWPNDLAIASDGTAYITDSKVGRVMKATNGSIEDIAIDPLLLYATPYDPFGVDGIVIDEERGFLVVSNVGMETLLRIDLETKEVVQIPVEGGPIAGMDGMLMDSKGHIIAVTRTSELYILKDNDDEWRSATLVGSMSIDCGVEGFNSAAITPGDNDNEYYLSFVSGGGLFGGEIKTYGLAGKFVFNPEFLEETEVAQVTKRQELFVDSSRT